MNKKYKHLYLNTYIARNADQAVRFWNDRLLVLVYGTKLPERTKFRMNLNGRAQDRKSLLSLLFLTSCDNHCRHCITHWSKSCPTIYYQKETHSLSTRCPCIAKILSHHDSDKEHCLCYCSSRGITCRDKRDRQSHDGRKKSSSL